MRRIAYHDYFCTKNGSAICVFRLIGACLSGNASKAKKGAAVAATQIMLAPACLSLLWIYTAYDSAVPRTSSAPAASLDLVACRHCGSLLLAS